MVAELEDGWKEENTVYKNSFTLDEVHEREKSLMLELNASRKEIDRLKAKLASLYSTFNGIYNETLNPIGADTKKEEKKRLVERADSRKNKEVICELVYNNQPNVEEKEKVVVERIKKLTLFEKLKGLLNV